MMTPSFVFFFFNDTATTEIYTLSLHDALPIFQPISHCGWAARDDVSPFDEVPVPQRLRILCPAHGIVHRGHEASRSEEHTSELQSPCNLVCRLLLEKKKNRQNIHILCYTLNTS